MGLLWEAFLRMRLIRAEREMAPPLAIGKGCFALGTPFLTFCEGRIGPSKYSNRGQIGGLQISFSQLSLDSGGV
jgi:hypothetical protein